MRSTTGKLFPPEISNSAVAYANSVLKELYLFYESELASPSVSDTRRTQLIELQYALNQTHAIRHGASRALSGAA